MRTLLTAAVAVGLLAEASLGVINIKLTADNTALSPGETTTIRIWGQGTSSGMHALGGTINATGPSVLTSDTGSFAWVDLFVSGNPHTPVWGTLGTNGGWSNFGSEQWTLYPPNYFAKDNYEELAHYIVAADAVGSGDVTLSFASKSVGGFKPMEFETTIIMGTITPVTITVVPEPVTLSLLPLGSLLFGRGRRD